MTTLSTRSASRQIANVELTNLNQISANSGQAIVRAANFGSIYTTYQPLADFADSSLIAHAQAIRWPGGTLAETSIDKYSLRFADVFMEANPGDADYDAIGQKGLTDALAYAVNAHADFSMVLPTRRYMTDVATGVADVKYFLVRLLNGDFGRLPQHVTLEIGNESSWLGWQNGRFTAGEGSYGYIANAFLQVIRTTLANERLNPHHIDIDVAVQMGTTADAGQRAIFSQITEENLRTVDYFVRHSGLVSNADAHDHDSNPNGYDFDGQEAILADVREFWNAAWNGHAPEMRVYDSAWNVGGAGSIEAMVGQSEYALGVRQAPAIIELFGQMIASGSDACAVWGAQDKASSLFGVDGDALSYGGHAFRLMAESLGGTHLVAGKIEDGHWTHTNARYDVIAYQDDSKVVMFISAQDIPVNGLDVTIDLADFGRFAYAWAESISSPEDSTDANDPANAFNVELDRFAVPVAHGNGHEHLTVTLSDDYEVIRVIAARTAPGEGRLELFGSNSADHLYGGSASDQLVGNRGADSLEGNYGRDGLTGGLGSDTLRGNAGNDRINGGGGDDVLSGGRGADTLTGGAGDDTFTFYTRSELGDTIRDFNTVDGNHDAIVFDADMFDGLRAGQVLESQFALNAAQDADDRFIYNEATHQLFYDADGTGAGDPTLLVNLSEQTMNINAQDLWLN